MGSEWIPDKNCMVKFFKMYLPKFRPTVKPSTWVQILWNIVWIEESVYTSPSSKKQHNLGIYSSRKSTPPRNPCHKNPGTLTLETSWHHWKITISQTLQSSQPKTSRHQSQASPLPMNQAYQKTHRPTTERIDTENTPSLQARTPLFGPLKKWMSPALST